MEEKKMEFITIDIDTWNRFTRCIRDINKIVDTNTATAFKFWDIKETLENYGLLMEVKDDQI